MKIDQIKNIIRKKMEILTRVNHKYQKKMDSYRPNKKEENQQRELSGLMKKYTTLDLINSRIQYNIKREQDLRTRLALIIAENKRLQNIKQIDQENYGLSDLLKDEYERECKKRKLY